MLMKGKPGPAASSAERNVTSPLCARDWEACAARGSPRVEREREGVTSSPEEMRASQMWGERKREREREEQTYKSVARERQRELTLSLSTKAKSRWERWRQRIPISEGKDSDVTIVEKCYRGRCKYGERGERLGGDGEVQRTETGDNGERDKKGMRGESEGMYIGRGHACAYMYSVYIVKPLGDPSRFRSWELFRRNVNICSADTIIVYYTKLSTSRKEWEFCLFPSNNAYTRAQNKAELSFRWYWSGDRFDNSLREKTSVRRVAKNPVYHGW